MPEIISDPRFLLCYPLHHLGVSRGQDSNLGQSLSKEKNSDSFAPGIAMKLG